MKNEYFEGVCYMCMQEAQVRCKNLYITGSEGTDLCWTCERKIHNVIMNSRRDAHTQKIKQINEGNEIVFIDSRGYMRFVNKDDSQCLDHGTSLLINYCPFCGQEINKTC